MIEFDLKMDALSPSIKKQLESQNCYLTKVNYEKYEKIKHAIITLGFHLSTKLEFKRNIDRFYNKITKDVNSGIFSILIEDTFEDGVKKHPIESIYINNDKEFIIIAHEKCENKCILIVEEK